jgi:SNF2 family DNA or RNA helicase
VIPLEYGKMKLFDYQKDGVRWLITREFDKNFPGGFLCDEMGLGKTVQMIAMMSLNRKKRTLIVVPNSIVAQWIDEVKKFSKMTVGEFYQGTEYDICITTYSQFITSCKNFRHFFKQHWDRVILDEGHEVRNKKSKRYKNILRLSSDIRWVISGTPVYNRAADYKTLLRFVTKESTVVPCKEQIILRRTKKDVNMDSVPECHFENVEVDMYTEEKDIYQAAFHMYRGNIADALKNSTLVQVRNMILLEALLRMRQICIHPKMYSPEYNGKCKKFEMVVEDVQAAEGKSLMFCQFHPEMNMFQEELEKHMKVFRLDGSVNQAQRKHVIERFNAYKKKCVFIIQIKAGGQGINLQEANHVFITAPAWNPATELQAIARAHRTGQKNEVWVRKYICVFENEDPSVEEAIINLQDHKSTVCAQVLNDDRIRAQIPVILKKSKAIQTIRKIFQV